MTNEEAREELANIYEEVITREDVCERRVIALEMALEALRAEPCEDGIVRRICNSCAFLKEGLHTEPYEDCINRQSVLREFSCLSDDAFVINRKIQEIVKKLPSVTPARKKGEWEVAIGYDPNRSFMCDCCMKMAYEPTPYCPNCGAEMEVEE